MTQLPKKLKNHLSCRLSLRFILTRTLAEVMRVDILSTHFQKLIRVVKLFSYLPIPMSPVTNLGV